MIPPYEHTYITLKIVETALVPVYKNPLHPTTLTPPPPCPPPHPPVLTFNEEIDINMKIFFPLPYY